MRKYRSQEFHDLIVSSRKQYRKVKRRARSIYKQEKRQRLHKMATDNPREFWREIKRMKGGGSSQSKIELSDFYQHFKHVFSDDSNFSSEHVEQFINQNFNI